MAILCTTVALAQKDFDYSFNVEAKVQINKVTRDTTRLDFAAPCVVIKKGKLLILQQTGTGAVLNSWKLFYQRYDLKANALIYMAGSKIIAINPLVPILQVEDDLVGKTDIYQ